MFFTDIGFKVAVQVFLQVLMSPCPRSLYDDNSWLTFAFHSRLHVGLFYQNHDCYLTLAWWIFLNRLSITKYFRQSDMIGIELHLISLVFFLSRPEPTSPGQTNGINTPEQLTGRFQVSAATMQEQISFCLIRSFISVQFTTLFRFFCWCCLIWTMAPFVTNAYFIHLLISMSSRW